jgi:hypothetical protein
LTGIDRLSLALVILLMAGLGVSFVGWGRSGSRSRSSYELVRSARSLDLIDGLWADVAQGWFVIPLLVAVAVVAGLFNRSGVLALLGVAIGSLLMVGWWQVKESILAVDTGATAGAVLGLAMVVLSLWLLLDSKGRGRSDG